MADDMDDEPQDTVGDPAAPLPAPPPTQPLLRRRDMAVRGLKKTISSITMGQGMAPTGMETVIPGMMLLLQVMLESADAVATRHASEATANFLADLHDLLNEAMGTIATAPLNVEDKVELRSLASLLRDPDGQQSP